MPPKGSWDANAERDVILAAWYSANGGDFKTDWFKAHDVMKALGYHFSKDAIK